MVHCYLEERASFLLLSTERMKKQRKEHDYFMLRHPAEVEAAVSKTLWTSWFSIPVYRARTKGVPVKFFQKFHVSLRASQETIMISGLGTSVAISDGQVKDTGLC